MKIRLGRAMLSSPQFRADRVSRTFSTSTARDSDPESCLLVESREREATPTSQKVMVAKHPAKPQSMDKKTRRHPILHPTRGYLQTDDGLTKLGMSNTARLALV